MSYLRIVRRGKFRSCHFLSKPPKLDKTSIPSWIRNLRQNSNRCLLDLESILSLMATVRRAVFHGGAALLMHNGYNSLGGLEIDKFIQKQYGGHLQYLTIQGYAFQAIDSNSLAQLCPHHWRLAFAWFAMTLSLAHDSFPSLPCK